ncbi:MAG TPA: hypothetical protein VN721_05805, partial [Flavipsychrobacter sp.]|nr:hypothetical protein [Flavipsychrobacter sp.]
MYRYHAKYFLPILILSFFGIQAFGQTSTVSDPLSTRENAPYSRFGIGEMWDGDNALLRGMGHISSAYESPVSVNSDNPASYAFLALTTYEVGAEASIRTLASADQNYTTGTATLSYLNIGIPIGKNAGMCIGMRPYTHIYYNFADTTNTALGNNTINSLIGTGGVNYAYVGAAGKYKNFSIGFNFGYMFGNINTSNNIYNSDTTNAYNSEFIQNTKIGGIYYKLGAMYEGKLSNKIGLRIGATFTMQQNLNAWRDEYWISTHAYPDTV